MPIRDGGYTYCQQCGSSDSGFRTIPMADGTGVSGRYLCKQCYRDWAQAGVPNKHNMSARAKLIARLADVETRQQPSDMERALVVQSLEENEEEILASIEAFGRALDGE